jgi:hypothetical protein
VRCPAVAHTVLAATLRADGGPGGRLADRLYFPRHWPRPDRTAFGARGDGSRRQSAAGAVVGVAVVAGVALPLSISGR